MRAKVRGRGRLARPRARSADGCRALNETQLAQHREFYFPRAGPAEPVEMPISKKGNEEEKKTLKQNETN